MHITSESEESVLIWQINRPDRRNALGPILAQELLTMIEDLKQRLPTWPKTSEKPRLLAIKTTPDRDHSTPIWIAGGDLKELSQLEESAEGRRYAETMSLVCQGLEELPIPVVALIDGLVIGGGIEFALAADLRFATKRSVFHFKQLELGLATAYASVARLGRILGPSRSLHFLLRSSRIAADKAFDLGLIHELVETAQDLDEELLRLKNDIERLNPASVETQKELFRIHSKNQSEAAELDAFEALWMNPYHKESLRKFLNKK